MEEKQRRRALVEKYYDKLDEVWAYGKAHSAEERNGQEFKNKMEQYRQGLYEIVRKKMLILYTATFKDNQHVEKFQLKVIGQQT